VGLALRGTGSSWDWLFVGLALRGTGSPWDRLFVGQALRGTGLRGAGSSWDRFIDRHGFILRLILLDIIVIISLDRIFVGHEIT